MEHSHRYRAYPTQEVAERLEHHLNVHRQLYNHVRWDYENSPEDDKPSEYDQRVCIVWRGDRETHLGARTLLPVVRVRDR